MLRHKLYLFMIIQQDTSGPAFEGLREVSSVEVSVTRRRLLLNQTVWPDRDGSQLKEGNLLPGRQPAVAVSQKGLRL